MHKKNKIEKKLTEHIDKLRQDAFIQHKEFDTTAKKRLDINQKKGYIANRPQMQTDVATIRGSETNIPINKQYADYKKTRLYAHIASIIANICSLGLYWIIR